MKVSRQRAWQLRMHAEGRCAGCGNTPLKTKWMCALCARKDSARNLARYYRLKAQKKWAAVTVALALAGCAIHPSAWTPYDPAGEWACQQEGWSASERGERIVREVYESCMRSKGFTKAQRVWAR